MACDLTVKAPNGKPSILYADLLSITNDAELAARIYIDTQTAKSKEQFKGKSMDNNGEPLLDNVDIKKFDGVNPILFATISDTVEDFNLTINTSNNYLYGFTVDEENYGINLGGSLALDHINKLKGLTLEQAVEQGDVKDKVVEWIRQISNYNFKNGKLNPAQHELNIKLADEIEKKNSILWDKVKLDIKLNAGLKIKDLDEFEYDPNNVSNSFNENQQFLVKLENRTSTEVKNLINNTVDREERISRLGGLPTKLRALNVLPHFVQNLYDAINKQDMLDKLKVLSKVNKSYLDIHSKLLADDNLANAFFRDIKSSGDLRVFLTINASENASNSFKVGIRNTNSFMQYQLADLWRNTMDTKRTSNFYKDSGILEEINTAYNSYKTPSQEDIVKHGNSIGAVKLHNLVLFLNKVGINISVNMLNDYVTDSNNRVILDPNGGSESLYKDSTNRKEDYAVYNLLEILDKNTTSNIHKYVNGITDKFEGNADLMRFAEQFKIWFEPGSIAYNNIENHTEQTYNKPTFLSDWMDTMRNDEAFLVHLKNLIRPKAARYSNWLIKTKDHNGFLLLPEGTTIEDLDSTIEQVTLNKSFYLEENGDLKFNAVFNEGIRNSDTGQSSRYSDIGDTDWVFTNIANYINGNRYTAKSNTNSKIAGEYALYSLLNPSDRGNNRFLSAPRVRLKKDDLVAVESSGITNKNIGIARTSALHKAVYNIFKGELQRMIDAKNAIYTLNGDMNRKYTTDEKLISNYHYKLENGKIVKEKDGKYIGNAFKFYNFNYTYSNKLYDLNDLFTITPDASVYNNAELVETIHTFIDRMLARAIQQERTKAVNISKQISKVAKLLNQTYDEAIAEYTINRYIANVEMTNLFLGDVAFYGNTLAANKRATQLITSGIINSDYGTEETFNGATINDRVIKNPKFVKDIDKMLKHLKVDNKVKEFIVNAYSSIDTTDGISYITLEEFSNRTLKFGTNSQYKSLIDKLNNPNYTLTVDDLTEVIQAQKDFYYGLNYDKELNLTIPVQVKNSEFVLIPKLLGENSQLKALYNAMISTGNVQINVQQAEKVGTKYVANISDSEGNLIEGFETELIKASRPYYYKNLRKQQEVVDHIQDEDNSRGVQLDKLILTNLSDENVIKEIFNINIANIIESSKELQEELGITNVDSNWNVDLNKFATVIKKHYIEDGANSNYVFGAKLDELTNTFKLPLDTPINRKKNESLITSMFSRNVINQKHPGAHGPQISNAFFDEMVTKTGIKKLSNLPTDKRLTMTYWEVKGEDVTYHKMQVLLPAWSKKFFGNSNITIEDLKAAGLDTMLGYRIPSEDKHSMFVFEVVGFLDSSQGSSIVVPDGFTIQTGSDFDIDSIYTMQYNFNIDKEGKIYKTKYYKTNEQIWDNHYQKAIDILEDLTKTKDTFESDNEAISKLLGNMLGVLPEQYTNEELDTAFKEKKEGYSLDLYNKLKAKVDSFPTKEEFMSRDIATNNTKNARQNRTLELYINILSSPEQYLENVSPNTTEDTNNSKLLAENYYNKYGNLSNYSMPATQDSLRELSLASRKLKGISVNRDGFLAIAQRVNLKLKDSKIRVKFNIIEDITININGKDIIIPKYTIDQLYEFFGEENVQTDGTVTLMYFGKNYSNGFFNIDGKLITSYAAQSTQHILDSVKFPLPYGVTENSLNDWRLLVDMGASWNIATLLINQQAINKVNTSANNKTQLTIKERGNAISSNRKQFLDDIFIQMVATNDPRLESLKSMDKYEEAITSINKNKPFIAYPITNALHDIIATDIVIGDQFLIDQLKIFVKFKTLKVDAKIEYLTDQLNVLNYYENIVKVNNQINDFQRLTSFDKSKVGPEFSDITDTYTLYDEVQTNNYNNKLITDTDEHYIDAIYNGESYPALKAYKEMGMDIVYNAFNNLFLNQSTPVSSLLSQYPKESRTSVLNYVYAYNLRTLPFFNNTNVAILLGLNNQSVKGIDIKKVTKENLDAFNDLSFVNKLMVVKEQYGEYIKDTNLLHYVNPIYGKAYIETNGRAGIEFVSDKPDDFFIQSFKTLWYNDNPFLHLLMQDMVKFAYFDTGLTFGRNISKVIPAEILYNEPIEIENSNYPTFSTYPLTKGIGFTSYMTKQRLLHFNEDYIDTYDNNFKIKFARSNWDRNNIVPRVSDNMEEDQQAFRNTGRTEYAPKYNTVYWGTPGVIKVTKAQFNNLTPLQQKADVVRYTPYIPKRDRATTKPSVKLYAKVRANNSNEFLYYYIPVNKLDSFEFEQHSRITSYNDPSIKSFDDYLLELGMIEVVDNVEEDDNIEQQPFGFKGYKGGFENVGKGTPNGDGKDKAMRKVADSAIVEIKGHSSSSKTTIDKLGNPNENSKIVMLARNSEFKGKSLTQETKDKLYDAAGVGMEFVVGDMPNVDSQFIDYLQEIGATFTIYHTGNTPRINVSLNKSTDNKSDDTQLSMFATIDDSPDSFGEYNQARMEVYRSVYSDYTERLRNAPSDILKETTDALGIINWGEASNAAEHAAIRALLKYTNFTLRQLDTMYYGDKGYTNKEVFTDIMSDSTKIAAFQRKLNFTAIFLKGFTKMNRLEPISGTNLTKDQETLNQEINRLLSFNNEIAKLQTTVDSLRRTMFEHILPSYSTNPDMNLGIRNMFDSQHDESWSQLFLAAMADTHNIFLANYIKKLRIDRFEEVETANKNIIREWDSKLEEFKKSGRTINDLMDKDGNFIQEFNNKYKEDKQDYIDRLKAIELKNNGIYNKEYYNLSKEYQKWKIDNMLSETADEVRLANFEAKDILDRNFEASKALADIRDRRSLISNNIQGIDDYSEISEEDIKALKVLKDEEDLLANVYDINTGELKTSKDLEIARTITEYKKAIGSVLSKYYLPVIDSVLYQKEYTKHLKGKTKEDQEWLARNTVSKFTNTFWVNYSMYAEILGRDETEKLTSILSIYKDRNGVVNGNLVNDFIKAKLKEATLEKYEDIDTQVSPKGFVKPKRDDVYTKDYETRMANKGDDSRETNDTILGYKKEISDILNKYLKEDGTIDTVNISIDDMTNLNTLYNKVKLDGSYGHKLSKMRVAFNKWYNQIHNPIFATKEFKAEEKKAKTRGANYYNNWKKLNTELYYTSEYYKLLESIHDKHFGKFNTVSEQEIDKINIDAIRELYKVNSFNDLPEDIKKRIINNSDIHYNGVSNNGIVYTLADYLDLHTNPRNKTAFAFSNKEFAAKEVKRLYDAIINKDPKYAKLIKDYRKSYLYQNDINDVNDITTTLEYQKLLVQHGEDSDWYNDNHTIDYKGDIVPLSYWTIKRPKNSKLFKENNPVRKFWSYNEMTDAKYIDVRKTGARKWMNENVDYITTPYYNETSTKLKETLSEEDYQKWYEDNHYYNPYTHTYQPISSWTMMSSNPDNISEHTPMPEVLKQKLVDKFNTINDPTDPYRPINDNPLPKKSSKYHYNNDSNKNSKFKTYDEVKADPLYSYITELLTKLMQHYPKDTIISELGLPIIEKANINNVKEAGKAFLRKAGWHNVSNNKVRTGENNEVIHLLNMPYLNQLIEKEEIQKPVEKEFPTREAYLIRYNEVTAANKEIRTKNAEYQKAHLDRDYESVIRQFIGASLDNKFKYEHEDETRLVLEEIRNLDMIKKKGLIENLRNATREKLSKTRPELFKDDSMLVTEKGINSNLEQHFRAFLDMVFYGDFESDEGVYTNIARVMQNFTSARGMWLNAPAAVNNVVFGQTQMGLEAASGYYFNQANANKAHVQYTTNLVSVIADTGKDKASTFISGILKYFDIIELQDEVAITSNKELNKGLMKSLLSVDTLYIGHHSGEHFLQNNGLLAMLDSHRLVGNKIQSFTDYTNDKHYKTLQNILDVKGKQALNTFIKDNKDKDSYINGKLNLIREFILTSNSGIQQEYLKELDVITKDAKKVFNELPKAIDIFNFKDGYITIKEQYSNVNTRVIGEFKTKVLKVNQKMQGVYNTFDAGTGQRKAMFRLVSQFKLKWMYPGLTKRFGTRLGETFWNEGRSEEDTGMYVSTWRFLTKPISDNIRNAKENNTHIAIGKIFKDYGDYITKVGLHWNSLTDTDKANIVRTATEGLQFASFALLLWIARGMAEGDDDDKKKWAYTLYTIDRLKTETLTYTPYGVVNEGRKFMSSPFAAMSMLDDIGKLMYVTLFEQGESYKGGIYHGESKVHVQLFKNVPLLNRYLRYENIEDYAGYYKLY